MDTDLRRRDWWRAPVVLGLTSAVVAFTALTVLTALGAEVDPLERTIFRFFNGLPTVIGPFLRVVMRLGDFMMVPAVVAVALLWRRPGLARDLALGGGLAWLAANGMKQLIGRPRPFELLADVIVRGHHAGLGYPSGHSAVAAALATVVAHRLPRTVRPLVWLPVLMVGVGRMYVGAHLPLDVLGGWVLGWLVASTALLAGRFRSAETGPLSRPGSSPT